MLKDFSGIWGSMGLQRPKSSHHNQLRAYSLSTILEHRYSKPERLQQLPLEMSPSLPSQPTSVLEYLRKKCNTQVHCDSLDPDAYQSRQDETVVDPIIGPFTQCTSNQALVYHQLSKPQEAENLKRDASAAGKSYSDTGRWNDRSFMPEWSSLSEDVEEVTFAVESVVCPIVP